MPPAPVPKRACLARGTPLAGYPGLSHYGVCECVRVLIPFAGEEPLALSDYLKLPEAKRDAEFLAKSPQRTALQELRGENSGRLGASFRSLT